MKLDPVTYRGKTYKIKRYYFDQYANSGSVLRIFDEGSSRSGKTFDTIDFLYDICVLSEKPLKIYIYRLTLQDCKEKTLGDFKKKLILRGVFDGDSLRGGNILPEYHIKDSVILFRGLDKMDVKEGNDCDIIYFNEMLDGISKAQFDNITMRCTRMVIGDWNPRYTTHWAFDLEGQPDTVFTHTTYKDNPFCPPSVIRTIEGYEPTKENIAAGTADEWRWKVYGLGVRAAQEGLVFPYFEIVDDIPDWADRRYIGVDFGYSNDPTAIVDTYHGFNVDGAEYLFLDELCYRTQMSTSDICAALRSYRNVKVDCESADPRLIDELAKSGAWVVPVKKGPDSVLAGIARMQSMKKAVTRRSLNIIKEFQNYVFSKNRDGAFNSYPVDLFNHAIDAARYVVLTEYMNRNTKIDISLI